MMDSLKEILEKDDLRPQLIKDCVGVLQAEIDKKKGVIGMAIRKGFSGVSKLKDGKMIEKAVDILLDDFIIELEPYYQQYRQIENDDRGDFADFLTQQDQAVAESLLTVTDRRREEASSKVLMMTYDNMRKVAGKNVQEAIPALGQLIQGYALAESA